MDVVFLNKDTPDNPELRYALRSVEACYPGHDVWLVGGKPYWAQNVGHVQTRQYGRVKWEATRLGLRAAVECEAISDPFILMNDDFFLLRPQRDLRMLHGGLYAGWLAAMRSRLGRSAYVRGGEATLRILKSQDIRGALCWSLHTPMRVDKTAARRALDLAVDHPRQIHMRTLIGNLSGLTGVQSRDVKLTGGTALPTPADLYVSTSDGSFDKGRIGRWIRAKFSEPSSFEQCSGTRPE